MFILRLLYTLLLSRGLYVVVILVLLFRESCGIWAHVVQVDTLCCCNFGICGLVERIFGVFARSSVVLLILLILHMRQDSRGYIYISQVCACGETMWDNC